MLVQFTRRDDGADGSPQLVAINPEAVSAVFVSEGGDSTVVRMKEGRGFVVRESYGEVMRRLEPIRQFDITTQTQE